VVRSYKSILDQLEQIEADLARGRRVYWQEDTGDLIVLDENGRPTVLGPALLRAHIEKESIFVVEKSKKGDPGNLHEVPIASVVLHAFIERRSYPQLPPYRGTRHAPFITTTGAIVTTPGYDPSSGIYLATKVPPLALPATPSQEEARLEMASLVDDIFADFPLGDKDRSVIAAAIFSIAARACTGPAPGFIFDSHTAGAGKTTAAELAAMVALGEPIQPILFRNNKDEFSKTVITSLRSRPPAILVDNVSSGLGCSELDGIVTSRSGKVRVRNLGKLEELELATATVVLATGNGITLDGDLRRRVLWVWFDPQQEDPENRTNFRQKKLYSYVLGNLPRFHRAVLLCWRAFEIAGRLPSGLPLLGSFEVWSEMVGSGCRTPCSLGRSGRKEIRPANSSRHSSRFSIGWIRRRRVSLPPRS